MNSKNETTHLTESPATDIGLSEPRPRETLDAESSVVASESSSALNPFRNFGIQDYLSLGYIYLLCVGIMTDAIYYKMLGVNILHFTSVLDVLVSPISFIVKRPVILIFLVVLPFGVRFLRKRVEKKQAIERKSKLEGSGLSSEEQQKRDDETLIYFFPVLMGATIFFLFVGGGIGAGYRVSGRIADGDLRINHRLVFNDGEEVEAYVVGQNSDFIFYVTDGSKHVTIAPVRGNVKRIDRIQDSEKRDGEHHAHEMEKHDHGKEAGQANRDGD